MSDISILNASVLARKGATPSKAAGGSIEVMQTLTPTHVVFNGAVGALTADVVDKVLFLHSQANRDSRPYLIGGHGGLVWTGGSFDDQPAPVCRYDNLLAFNQSLAEAKKSKRTPVPN